MSDLSLFILLNNAGKYCDTTLPILAKNHFFKRSSFWSWWLCKEAKFSHLGHRKPVRIQWIADAPKTSHCLVRILVQRHARNCAIFFFFFLKMSKERPLHSMAIVIGSQKLKRRTLATFVSNRTALYDTQAKLHSIFCALFLKIALSAAELMSFSHLEATICHRWTIICWVPSKIIVTPKTERQLRFKGQYSWSHWWNTAAHSR